MVVKYLGIHWDYSENEIQAKDILDIAMQGCLGLGSEFGLHLAGEQMNMALHSVITPRARISRHSARMQAVLQHAQDLVCKMCAGTWH